MSRLYLILFYFVLLAWPVLKAQADVERGFEGILVEEYYSIDKKLPKKQRISGLTPGMKTYRIYVDLKPGFRLLAVYGLSGQPMVFRSSTFIYNHPEWSVELGDLNVVRRYEEFGVALDSWLSMGPASYNHSGVPLDEDRDGSVIPMVQLNEVDGLFESEIPSVIGHNLKLYKTFGNVYDASGFETDDGALAVLGGVTGVTPENRILVGQITTDGELSFEFNILIGAENCEGQRYVARNPNYGEYQTDDLIYPRPTR